MHGIAEPRTSRSLRLGRPLALVLAFGIAAAIGASPALARPATPGGSSSEERRAAWQWPVGPPVVVVAPFRAPATPYSAGHRGVDLDASVGDVVVAPAAGRVSFAGVVVDRPLVAIDHGDGVVSAIEAVEPLVAEGEPVAAGEPIGSVAAGGHCDGRCVHFGVRIDGEYVSPFVFLGGVPRSVLLPMG